MKTLKFKIEEFSSHTSINLIGDIVGMGALNLKQELKKYTEGIKNLKIDLTEVQEISLTGLNSLLISRVYANNHNNTVTLLVKEESKILEHLHLTKLTDQFIIKTAV